MKNYIPLVLAVLLGLGAVLAVGRLLKERQQKKEETASVVAVTRNIAEGEVLTKDALRKWVIPASARPNQAISWSRMERVEGLKALRAITAGDYLLNSDIGSSDTLSGIVGEGEWAVTLDVSDAAIGALLQPADEVAIIGTFALNQEVKSADLSAPAQSVQKLATMVLFPRVRILDVMGRGGAGEKAASQVIVGLPPQQAQTLIAAKQKFKLTLALRRRGDETWISRFDIGMVDDGTFDRMLEKVTMVTIPEKPGMIEKNVNTKKEERQ